jgi:hypothetical protein
MASRRYYSKKDLSDLRTKFQAIGKKSDKLREKYVAHPFQNEKAKEYALHGFSRRIGTLHRCIENVFNTVPPGTIKIPSEARLHDVQISLQAFVANVYGSVDNLAWVWVHERGLGITKRQVGLRRQNVQIRESLSIEFQDYLKSIDKWFEYISEYRDALAHRIPLYNPPGGIRPSDRASYDDLQWRMSVVLGHLDIAAYEELKAKQAQLLAFHPVMTHSFSEAAKLVPYHDQMIADFLTVEVLAFKMLAELRGLRELPYSGSIQ